MPGTLRLASCVKELMFEGALRWELDFLGQGGRESEVRTICTVAQA